MSTTEKFNETSLAAKPHPCATCGEDESNTAPPIKECELLTLREAADHLRIGRTLCYQLADEFLTSGGITGLPVIRLGAKCLRVPRWALIEYATTGRTPQLTP